MADVDYAAEVKKYAPDCNDAAVKGIVKHLGIALKKSEVSVRYIGQCHLAGAPCDHLVMVTPEGHVSVILVADKHPSTRVLVADRRMTALLSPARDGAYIVVAESPKAVKRARKLFVQG